LVPPVVEQQAFVDPQADAIIDTQVQHIATRERRYQPARPAYRKLHGPHPGDGVTPVPIKVDTRIAAREDVLLEVAAYVIGPL
jgi:hypothetical protein